MPTPLELALLKRQEAADFVGPQQPTERLGQRVQLTAEDRKYLQQKAMGMLFGFAPAYDRLAPHDQEFNESLWEGGQPVIRTLTNPDGSEASGTGRVTRYTSPSKYPHAGAMKNRPGARTMDIELPKEKRKK